MQSQIIKEDIETIIPELADKYILQEAINLANASNMPKGYIDNIQMKTEGTTITLYNEWKKDDLDLADFFENGTTRHWVEPRVINSPTGRVPGGRQDETFYDKKGKQHKSEPISLHWESNGLDFFSKGHFVNGIHPFQILKQAIESGIPRIITEIEKRKEMYEK